MENSKAVNNWIAQDLTGAEYIGIIEFEDPREAGEYIYFEIFKTDSHLIFGHNCNIGMLESGNYQLDPDFSDDEALSELISDLETYYRDGKEYVTDCFSCNERM